jgi:hypothetical protein
MGMEEVGQAGEESWVRAKCLTRVEEWEGFVVDLF